MAGGHFKGQFTEEMFDEGQKLDQPYYQTKFEAEKLVREGSKVPYRIYRPGMVIGSSEDGHADRVDGPYYAFKIIQRLRAAVPAWVPLIGFEGGPFNIVPVDFVARAIDRIAAKPRLDGQTFHIVDPAPLSLGDAALEYINSRATFPATNAQKALVGTGVACPPLHSYAWKVWDFWERHLDPEAMTGLGRQEGRPQARPEGRPEERREEAGRRGGALDRGGGHGLPHEGHPLLTAPC